MVLAGTPSRRDAEHRRDSLAAFGVTEGDLGNADEPATEVFELWPENCTPVGLFMRMRGQWRMAPGGPIALDYSVLPTVAKLMRIGRRDLREAFEPLREMEAEALAWIEEQRPHVND